MFSFHDSLYLSLHEDGLNSHHVWSLMSTLKRYYVIEVVFYTKKCDIWYFSIYVCLKWRYSNRDDFMNIVEITTLCKAEFISRKIILVRMKQ